VQGGEWTEFTITGKYDLISGGRCADTHEAEVVFTIGRSNAVP
jgi:hypothetical protein